MNKHERVMAALHGRQVDRVPVTMWRHFYAQDRTAQSLARATLDFYRQYNLDMIVLMPGPFYMAEAWDADLRIFGRDEVPPYIVSPVVARATDWRQLPSIKVTASSLSREIEAVRLIKAQLVQDDVPLVFPIFSPLTTANVLCDGRVLDDMRSFSNDLRSGLEIIASATVDLARACLDAGADGVMLINHLASKDQMRSREYRSFGRQFDVDVLNALVDFAEIRILNMPGEHVFFDQCKYYPVQAINWDTWRAEPSLSDVRRQLHRSVMGGLNPAAFANGAIQDVQSQVTDAIEQTGGWHLLIAPSHPLPPDSRHELMLAVHEAVQAA